MSEILCVKSSKHNYEVRFENDFAAALSKELRESDVILVDATVKSLYADKLNPLLKQVKHIVVEPSEARKSYQGIEPFLDELIKNGFRKNQRLIAIGGGITQDITAFMASILFRGVQWLFYPTTLLAQCDSCIGSKTSINFGKFKNQLGGFYPPNEIVIDLNFLETLSPLDFRSGMGEMIHFYLVSGEEDFKRMQKQYDLSFTDKKVLRNLVWHSLEIKRSYAECDEFDQGPRNIFNYGHSFGHAIESLTNYEVPHGIAVSFGMDIANYISLKKGYISEGLYQDVRSLLSKNWGDTKLCAVNLDNFKAALLKDKKVIGTTLHVILTKGMGKMFKTPLELDEQVGNWIGECLNNYL